MQNAGLTSLLSRERSSFKRKAAQVEAELAGMAEVTSRLQADLLAAEQYNAKVLNGIQLHCCPHPGGAQNRTSSYPERQRALASRLKYYSNSGGSRRIAQTLNFTDASTGNEQAELRKESARLATFRGAGPPGGAAEELSAAGFYLNEGGSVRCAFCRGALEASERLAGESAMAAHARRFATCPFVIHMDVGNEPLRDREGDCCQPTQCSSSELGSDADTTSESGQALNPRRLNEAEAAALFSAATSVTFAVTAEAAAAATSSSILTNLETLEACAAGIPAWRSEMVRFDARLRTMSPSKLSQLQRPAPPADVLAAAGFFLEGRCLCCHSCGLRLTECHADADPWLSHAIWSPRCPHLLLTRGAAFVRAVRCHHPLLPLPPAAVANRSGSAASSVRPSALTPLLRRPEELGVFHFRLGQREVRARADTPEMRTAMRILGRGADAELRAIVELRLAAFGDDFPSGELLLAAVFDLRAERLFPAAAGSAVAAPLVAEEFAAERLRCLRAAWPSEPPPIAEDEPSWRVCKVCMDRQVNVLLVDCGHLCCCSRCSKSLTDCPICRRTIRAEAVIKP